MNVSLTPNLESFIRERAASGDYNNSSEVVREAIRLLKRTEQQQALKLERLRASISEGDQAIKRGEFSTFNTDEELDAFFAQL